jgi:hypothetical protein
MYSRLPAAALRSSFAAHGSLPSRSRLRLYDNLRLPMDLCQAAAGCGSSIILRRPWIVAKPPACSGSSIILRLPAIIFGA